MDNLKYKTAIFALGVMDIGYATALLDAPEDAKLILTDIFKTGCKHEKLPAHFIKHIFRDIFAIAAIGILSPLLVIICIMIFAASIRTAIINHKPIGLRRYDLFNFRSRVKHTEETNDKTGGQYERNDQTDKTKNDLKISNAGRIFRRTSRDEIPQLFTETMVDIYNIGTVKTLPWKPEHNEPIQLRKSLNKPRPTGSWQIFLHGNEVNMKHWVKMGIHFCCTYSNNSSFSAIRRRTMGKKHDA